MNPATPRPPPRFDYYTNPGAAFSSASHKRRSADPSSTPSPAPAPPYAIESWMPFDVDSQASSHLPRPIGRKATKVARSRGASSSGTHGLATGGLNVTQFDKLNETKAMVELMREQLAIMKDIEEERIMKIDVDSCTGPLRDYYKMRQDAILAKWSAMASSE